MLFVERSNRTERLLEGLAARITAPSENPLAPSMVVVQGPGMERWLAQSIARRYGVCANTEFLFPRQLLERVFETLPGDDPVFGNSAWEVNRLTWSVARLLFEGRGEPDFEPLARHLDAIDGDWRLVQLSRQIATLLDQYITFRPEWIRDWGRATELPVARDARWQARLVRDLTTQLGPGHFADRASAFLAAVSTSADPIARKLASAVSGRIEIFALSTLPPLYLSVLDGLARVADVHLSILSPTQGYWADLWREVREGEIQGLEAGNASEASGLFEALPATPAARLLAGLGRLGGDFQRCLEERVEAREEECDDYESPLSGAEAPSLLARLQADLLELDFGLGEGGVDSPSLESHRIVREDDDSIQIHFCHGPRRELEVVEATLREAFEKDAGLAPEDVIVMAPRIDEIAPEIEAVFGVPHSEGRSIPYRIADRGALKRSPVAEAFLSLLDLMGGRATRSGILDWLSLPPARERFGLDEEAVERFGEWAEGAGIRFGLDEEHRERLGLARERRHTWSAGLERLALAHATGASAEVFAGVAPAPLDAFSDPSVLGAFGEVESMLREALDVIAVPRSVGGWCDWLTGMLERGCLQTEANAHEHTAIRSLLEELASSALAGAFDAPIRFEAIREQVSTALDSSPAPQAFLAGGVTFCELVPLRAIPFKVIVIMGLSDVAFPRGRPPLGFDLMARAPQPGDRSTRSDDRYLFLEALLSARDRLILTVPGRDVRDGSDLPPSIVLSELLDAIEDSFTHESGVSGRLREALVVEHPLHGFSPRYFERSGDARLIAHDEEAFAGAQARRSAVEAGGGETRRFLSALDPTTIAREGAQSPPSLSLDELVQRVLRSTRHFSRERLHVRLPRTEEVPDDLDPYDLGPLEKFALGAALLDDLASGTSSEDAHARLLARASIPPGMPGRLAASALEEEVEEIARRGRTYCSGSRLEDAQVELAIEVEALGTCVLQGQIDRLWEEGRIQIGFGRVDGRGEFEVWIRHLFLCAAVEAGLDRPARSVLIGRSKNKDSKDQVVLFEEVEDARRHLARLFEWAWSSNVAPIPFFPKTSKKFADRALNGKHDQAWREANQSFYGGESGGARFPESEEELEYARVWEGVSPLDVDADLPLAFRFDTLAEEFFRPLLAARRVESE